MSTVIENVIIIGAGPAGLTAALYTSRAFLNPLVIEGKHPGGQLMGTTAVENWPGTQSILGPQLMMNMHEHAAHFGTRFMGDSVISVDFSKKPLAVTTKRNGTLYAHAVIIATGAVPNCLQCPGEDDYWGRGVTTCAVCDGALYPHKKIIIVGGGDTAMEDASFMTKFTNDITIVHILDHFTASPIMQQRVLNNPTINIIYSSTVSAIEGDGTHVTGVTVTNQITGISSHLEADVVFLAIGQKPSTALFKDFIELDPFGYIVTKSGTTATSCEGVFCAGDAVDFKYKQAIVSAGQGCKAAIDVQRYLEK